MIFKKALAIISSVIIASSMLTISASAANTGDTYYTYSWSNGSRYDSTPARYKYNNTPVYLCAIDNTLPYGGFYASTFYGTSSSNTPNKASASEYLVNDYLGHTIRANGTSVSQKNKWVCIRGHYKNTTYSWGDCRIAWSPDTANAYNYSSLN